MVAASGPSAAAAVAVANAEVATMPAKIAVAGGVVADAVAKMPNATADAGAPPARPSAVPAATGRRRTIRARAVRKARVSRVLETHSAARSAPPSRRGSSNGARRLQRRPKPPRAVVAVAAVVAEGAVVAPMMELRPGRKARAPRARARARRAIERRTPPTRAGVTRRRAANGPTGGSRATSVPSRATATNGTSGAAASVVTIAKIGPPPRARAITTRAGAAVRRAFDAGGEAGPSRARPRTIATPRRMVLHGHRAKSVRWSAWSRRSSRRTPLR